MKPYVWTDDAIRMALGNFYREEFERHFNRKPTTEESFAFYKLCNPQGD